MKTFDELLIDLHAYEEAKAWAQGMTIEQVVASVERGDWLLWLAKKTDIPKRPLTLAKARCAKTVIHLMKDERSINAVNLAEEYGLSDEVSEDDLRKAAAYAAADAAYDDALSKNQLQTAEICREVLGKMIIARVNELLTN